MTNHHGNGFFVQLSDTFHVWLQRQHDRRQLAELSERDRHDLGLSWSDVVQEAEKPFWRA
jgi:uncharacterized protein YjiS (DUF1127 family)